jgi:maltooligosyltrehalose trehalohydrolase
MLFQGEEWGARTPFLYFTDHDDPDLGKAVTEGRRREFASFGWDPTDVPDPQDPETFRRSKLDWDERSQPEHADILDWHRRLIALRRSLPALTGGGQAAADGDVDVAVDFDEAARWLVYSRPGLAVVCNLGDRQVTVPVPPGKLELSSSDGSFVDGDRAHLDPESVIVLTNP